MIITRRKILNLIIHDLDDSIFKEKYHLDNMDDKKNYIISDNGCIKSCTGCFGCWVKTPGRCVIKDGYENMGGILAKAGNVYIISQCYYGGYSPFVKNVLDRSISYLLPFFRIKDNETHHKQRYKHTFRLCVYFYGDNITEHERDTAIKLVKANCVNFNVQDYKVLFAGSAG